MIKTYEELAALPKDTPIRDALGYVWGSAGLATEHAAECGYDTVLPAVQLIPTTVSKEQVSDLRGVLYDAGVTGKTLDTAVVEVLSTLGLEVSDE